MRLLLSIILFIPMTVLLSQEVKYENSIPSLLQETKIRRLADFSIDGQSNYYLLDSDLKKIWVYDSNSKLVDEIPKAGNSINLENPVAIELTSDNNLMLLDAALKKIFTFDKNGSAISEFGNDRGVTGSFESPVGMALDVYDNVYVIDKTLQQIIKFNKDGLFRGNESIINPISIAVDIEQNVYVLAQNEDEGTFKIVSFPFDLRSRLEIRISNVIDPVDITVNQFGEFYVVDKEYRKVFHYGPAGNLIGEQIGVKSSSAGPGKFSDAAAVNNKFVNNEIDMLYVLDLEFNYVQSFSIQSRHERKKLYTQPLELDINLDNSISNIQFEKFFAVKDLYNYVSSDNTITGKKNGGTVYSIKHSELDDVAAITAAMGNIYVADRGAGEVFAFSASDGSFKFKFGDAEGLSSPAGIASDSKGDLYVADYGNNRVVIYSASGIHKGKINSPGNSMLINPVDLTIDENDNLFILVDNDMYLFKYDIPNKTLSQLRYPFRNIDTKNTQIEAAEADIVMICNSTDGVISLFRDGIELARFLSKGTDENELADISGLFYDRDNRKIIVSDKGSNKVKEFRLELASRQTLKLTVNDFGSTELLWESKDKLTESYKLFRKRSFDTEFQFFAETNEPSYVVYENAESIYDYAVKIISTANGEGDLSNSVSDRFTYCMFIKNDRPEVAIDMLNQIKYLNENVINNQIYTVYGALLNRYKEQQKYDLALQTVTKMKQLKPKNYVLYVNKAEIYELMYNYGEAIAELKTAMDAFPENINLYYHLIRIMQLNKEYDEVVKLCNEGLSKFPGDENIIASIAEAYKNQPNYPEARKYYRMLAQQYGKEKYFLEEARILIAEGKYDEAFEMYKYIQTSGVATAALYSEIAEAHILQEDYNSALDQLNTGLKNDKDNAHLHYLMGVVYSKQGKSQSAISSFEKAVELENGREEYFISLGDEYLASGNKDNVTFNYESALLINPNNLDVLVKLGNLYLEQEKVDYAYRLLSKARAISPGSSDIQSAFAVASDRRREVNASREPIEFNFIEVGELTPVLIDYYSRNPFGSVTIFNTRNDSFTDIIIEISCPDLFSAPALVSIPLLMPNEFSEKFYTLNFENDLYNNLSHTQEELDISFTVKYMNEGQEKILTQSEKIVLFW